MTVRQVFYALTVAGVVPKEEAAGYLTVQVQVANMRREGVLATARSFACGSFFGGRSSRFQLRIWAGVPTRHAPAGGCSGCCATSSWGTGVEYHVAARRACELHGHDFVMAGCDRCGERRGA